MATDPLPGPARLKRLALERAQPLSALLELTYACNWRCVFCYNPRHHDRRGLRGPEWIGVLDELRHLGTLWVTLSGGEALAHPDFLDIARGARARALGLRIFTNGSLLDAALADQIAAMSPLAVEMSLHGGRPETHDRTTLRPGSFAAMLQGLDLLRTRAVPLVLKTPLTRLNEDELDLMEALAEERGVTWRIDATLTPRDDGDVSPLQYSATPAGVERLFRRLAERGRLPHVERRAGEPNCGLGRTTLAIDPEGNVFPCVQWRRAPIGNVRTAPLRALWHASPARQEAARASGVANDALLDARGGLARFPFCPALALERSGDPARPDEDHRQRAALADRVREATG